MKIIKRGTPPEDVVYGAACIRCGTEFEFTRAEAEVSHDQQDLSSYISIACPVCGKAFYRQLSSRQIGRGG